MSAPPGGRALRILFWLAGRAPWTLAVLRPLAVRVVPIVAPQVRRHTLANARRIFGRPSRADHDHERRPAGTADARIATDRGPPAPRSFPREVVGQFYDFVRDIGRAGCESAEQLRSHIVAVEGEPAYLRRRQDGCGAVLVTAHMGSFEVGLAALRGAEADVRVVFKRDPFDGFETLRRRIRRTLGVTEAAIDDGWPTLMGLRDALRANGVVVMQADRAMPGQKSAVVPFLGGHLRLPLGPLKLAQAAGSPVVPVFTVRESPGRFRVCIEPAIDPAAPDAIEQVAATLERFVRRYPTQWLVLHPAFVEDEASCQT